MHARRLVEDKNVLIPVLIAPIFLEIFISRRSQIHPLHPHFIPKYVKDAIYKDKNAVDAM